MNHLKKLETALATVCATLEWPDGFDPETQIHTGESGDDKEAMLVVCEVSDAEDEDPPLTGNVWTTCQVYVKTPVADSLPDLHQEVATVLESGLLDTELPDLLTAAVEEFTCIAILDYLPFSERQEDVWITGYRFRCYSCASDLV